MRRVRRSTYLFFTLNDELVPDIGRLLGGEVELVPYTRLVALSALTGQERQISDDELRLIASLPSSGWADVAGFEDNSAWAESSLRELALTGVVICDAADEPFAGFRELDERLTEIGWSKHAALYHAYSRWRDVDVGQLPTDLPEMAESRPNPPPAFHAVPGARESVDLPFSKPTSCLHRVLLQRKTTRSLDPSASLTLEELGALLYYTFGCQGYLDLGGGVVLVKRTSPSGGSLHPVEAYPLVVEVHGLPSGLYHYRSDRHALEQVTPLTVGAARELLVEAAAGQTYLAGASLLVIMTGRFDRSFWKYRHPRAYAVVHMDAAHLTQTFYLLCAELGLGAFVSAATNAGNLEDRLGLNGFEEGVLAVCGCGRPSAAPSPFDPEFEPYVPRETRLAPGAPS
jgi:putative peptide maturation dehydrogenase